MKFKHRIPREGNYSCANLIIHIHHLILLLIVLQKFYERKVAINQFDKFTFDENNLVLGVFYEVYLAYLKIFRSICDCCVFNFVIFFSFESFHGLILKEIFFYNNIKRQIV